MSRRAAALVAIACLVAATDARGDDVEQAKARFRHAVELFKQQRWREAAGEFEAAYRLKPHGAIHYNVAQCRERLEEWPAALRSYHDYLREVPDAKDRATVRASMKKIEERLAGAGVQVLLVYSDPPGARVTLEGTDRGAAPLHLVLAPGEYTLALALEGHEPAAEKVELGAKASRSVDVVLRRAPKPAAPPAAAPETRPAPDLAARPPAAEPARLPTPPPSDHRMLPTWVALGTAAVAAAAGAWFGASARADERAIDALPAPNGPEADRLAQSAQKKARTANALYVVAGGAAAAGVALYVFEARF
jgi:hypothetical protein